MRRLIPHYSELKHIAFLCCDIQDRFNSVPLFDQCVNVANRFAAASAHLQNSTFIATYQAPELEDPVKTFKLPKERSVVVPKQEISMVPSIDKHINNSDILILFGVEAHVCVLQTVGDVLEKYPDKTLVLAVDGIASCHHYDEKAAFQYFQGIQSISNGKFLMHSSESILFQLARSTEDKLYKHMSDICREQFPPPPDKSSNSQQ